MTLASKTIDAVYLEQKGKLGETVEGDSTVQVQEDIEDINFASSDSFVSRSGRGVAH